MCSWVENCEWRKEPQTDVGVSAESTAALQLAKEMSPEAVRLDDSSFRKLCPKARTVQVRSCKGFPRLLEAYPREDLLGTVGWPATPAPKL